MNKKLRWIRLGIVCVLSFALIFSGQVFADEVTIVGEITEEHQIVTEDSQIYDVADTDMGDDLMNQVDVGKKVKIKGTVKEEEGQKVIDVTSYEVIETD
jgi:hypothetical protein